MPRIPLVLVLAGGLAGCSCSKSPPPAPVTPVVPVPSVATGTAAVAATEKKQDEMGRGYLESLKRRAFDPRRDAQLERLEGEAAVRVDGRDAKYRFTFDGSKDAAQQVWVEPVTEPAGLAPGAIREVGLEVSRWIFQSVRGAYHGVAYYIPPIPLVLVNSADGRNLIVWAQPYRDGGNVSYSFDDREVVAIRGEWKSDTQKVVTNYDWELWRGRYLLKRAAIVDGAVTEFEYDDKDGVNLMRKAHLRHKDRVFDAIFTYSNLQRGRK